MNSYFHKSYRINILFSVSAHGRWKTLHFQASLANVDAIFFPFRWRFGERLTPGWIIYLIGPIQVSVRKPDSVKD